MLLDTFTQFDPFGRYRFSMEGQGLDAPVDIRRDGDRYVIDADLPGVDPESVDVTVEGDSLTIRAERSEARTKDEAQWIVRERRASTSVRRFTLGEDIDPDGVEADFHDGVLSVVVPVAAGARHRKIPVALGSGEHLALSGKAEAARSLES